MRQGLRLWSVVESLSIRTRQNGKTSSIRCRQHLFAFKTMTGSTAHNSARKSQKRRPVSSPVTSPRQSTASGSLTSSRYQPRQTRTTMRGIPGFKGFFKTPRSSKRSTACSCQRRRSDSRTAASIATQITSTVGQAPHCKKPLSERSLSTRQG